MTTEVKEKIWQKLGEAGILVIVLGGIIYFMYQWIDESNKTMRSDIEYLKEEVQKCRQDNMNILLENNRSYIQVIERNNRLIENLER
jgi:hypothetical protein